MFHIKEDTINSVLFKKKKKKKDCGGVVRKFWDEFKNIGNTDILTMLTLPLRDIGGDQFSLIPLIFY